MDVMRIPSHGHDGKSRRHGTSEATADKENFVGISRQEPPACVPKQIFLSYPSHLIALAWELSATFRSERASGEFLDNRQDPVMFTRLHNFVQNLMKAYSQNGVGDWQRYAAWSEHSYLRHLLWGTEDFELMLLCWRPGQTSRVHTHANSHCWFAVLDGSVRETQYRPLPVASETFEEPQKPASRAATATAADLTPTLITDRTVGDVAYINDNIAMHSVGCGGGQLACTLHVYCPPIRRAKALEGGRLTDCVPGFYSRHAILAA